MRQKTVSGTRKSHLSSNTVEKERLTHSTEQVCSYRQDAGSWNGTSEDYYVYDATFGTPLVGAGPARRDCCAIRSFDLIYPGRYVGFPGAVVRVLRNFGRHL